MMIPTHRLQTIASTMPTITRIPPSPMPPIRPLPSAISELLGCEHLVQQGSPDSGLIKQQLGGERSYRRGQPPESAPTAAAPRVGISPSTDAATNAHLTTGPHS